MTVFASVQIFLAMMLLGVYVGDVRIGSSAFLLIRELPENIGLPWPAMANYLGTIPQFADGRGLNPLLQNYWMVTDSEGMAFFRVHCEGKHIQGFMPLHQNLWVLSGSGKCPSV